jgi:hypothetical protein
MVTVAPAGRVGSAMPLSRAVVVKAEGQRAPFVAWQLAAIFDKPTEAGTTI